MVGLLGCPGCRIRFGQHQHHIARADLGWVGGGARAAGILNPVQLAAQPIAVDRIDLFAPAAQQPDIGMRAEIKGD